MKIEPPAPLDEETSKQPKNRGCAPMVMLIIAIVLLATLVLWVLLWTGGADKAEDEAVKPATQQAMVVYESVLLAV